MELKIRHRPQRFYGHRPRRRYGRHSDAFTPEQERRLRAFFALWRKLAMEEQARRQAENDRLSED